MEPTTRNILLAGCAGVAIVALVKQFSDPSIAAWRKAMLKRAAEHVDAGTLYQWGGGHPGIDSWGLDCSGLVIDAAKAAGYELEWNSNSMWQLLPHVEAPEPGDVALYGYNGKAVHVTMVEQWFPDEGRAAVIGAQGGDQTTTSPAVAQAQGAFVRRVADHRTDKRFMGFATLADIAEGRRSGKAFSGLGGVG